RGGGHESVAAQGPRGAEARGRGLDRRGGEVPRPRAPHRRGRGRSAAGGLLLPLPAQGPEGRRPGGEDARRRPRRAGHGRRSTRAGREGRGRGGAHPDGGGVHPPGGPGARAHRGREPGDGGRMKFDVVTIFPRMLQAPIEDGIVHRAIEAGLVSIGVHDLRAFTDDRHRSVDDQPFGGGPGMVMKAEPFLRAVETLTAAAPDAPRAVVLLSPRGQRFDQRMAERLSKLDHVVLLCGRYEGIDERVREALGAEEVSLGDFVLTGGEVAALAVIEAAVRLLPGALGDEGSAEADSFSDGVLDYPNYTRPSEVRGHRVPDVLLSGDHGKIRRWRRKEALRATRARRPDLLERAPLSAEDRTLLRELENEEFEVTASKS